MSKYKEVSIADINDTLNRYIETTNGYIEDIYYFFKEVFHDNFKNKDVIFKIHPGKKIQFELNKGGYYGGAAGSVVHYFYEVADKNDTKWAINNFADDSIKEKIERLNELLKLEFKFKVKIKKEIYHLFNVKQYITDHAYEDEGTCMFPLLGLSDDYKRVMKSEEINTIVKIKNKKQYEEIIALLEKYTNKLTPNALFSEDGKLLDKYKGKNLDGYTITDTYLDGKNISGLDVSKNLNININFDKIVKDVSGCNFNGYNLKKITFRNFNIQDTDFRNTAATIDLATCTISKEGKMNQGTLFDENNTFLFLNKKLSLEQVKDLGIKIYKKEK